MSDHKSSLMEMAQGAFKERVDYELARVVDNILDLNTTATAKRIIQVKITLVPDKQRQAVAVQVDTISKLAPVDPVGTTLVFSGNENGEPILLEVGENVPGQLGFDGTEQEQPRMLSLQRHLRASSDN